MQTPINTDREIYSLKPQAARYERAVSKARGLSVLIFPNGVKTFVVRYASAGGERRRLPLGDYPGVTLADARLKAAAVRIEIAEGKDPAAERASVRVQARFGETLADLAEGYWAAAAIGIHGGRRKPLKPDTIVRQKELWTRYIEPSLGRRRFRDIKRADVRVFMEAFVTEGRLSPSSIASIGDALRALFAYALHNDLVESTPTTGLTRPVTPESRSRLFDEDALALLLVQLDDASSAFDGRSDPYARMGPTMALALRLLILTLCRRSEVAGARRAEFDFDGRIWTVPAERTKNRQVHIVPLSSQALAVVRQALALPGAASGDFLFPSPTVPGAHLDPHAMTRAVSRLCTRAGVPKGSPHDFRRTGATILTGERYSVRRFVVGKVLGHTAHEGAAVTSVYDRNEYLAEKRAALASWGAHVEGLMPRGPGFAQGSLRRASGLRLVSSR
ncbi:MAG: integrase arm-type DNA-binding domain-containing protein [Pseudomonadota bacterium]